MGWRKNKRHMALTHPDGEYELIPDGTDVPRYPEGYGGIALRSRFAGHGGNDRPDIPQFGVDGRPAAYGYGRSVIVVPAGDRLISAQADCAVSERSVHVGAGETVAVDYAAVKGSWITARTAWGVLGPEGVRAPGFAPFTVFLAYVVLGPLITAVISYLVWRPLLRNAESFFGVVLVCTYIGVMVSGWTFGRRRSDRIRRRTLGPPAEFPVATNAPVRAAWFVGDVPGVEPPVLPEGCGGVVVQLQFTSSVRKRGRIEGFAFRPLWMEDPVVCVDGQRVPGDWSGWCYAMTPGFHDVQVSASGCESVQAEVLVEEDQIGWLRGTAKLKVVFDHTESEVLERTGSLEVVDA